MEPELERVITSSESGKRRKRILDQPHPIYRKKRWVLTHVNCCTDATIREEYSISETTDEGE